MLSDRPYMRGDYPRETTSVATWLACAIAGAFAIQFALESRWLAAGVGLRSELAFSIDGFVAGRLWTPLTHWLLHDTTNLFHVGLCLAGILLLGRELIGELGPRRFVAVYAASILAGAVGWGAFHWRTGGELIGSTAGIYGLVAVYALLYPSRQIRFLFFFFFPVIIRPKHIAVGMFLADSLAFVLVDILHRVLPFDYAPSAHLGGMIAGWAFYQLVHERPWRFSRTKRAASPELSLRKSTRSPVDENAKPAGTPDRPGENIRTQVDRVLDKINSNGFGALTPAERRILDDAKELLSRR